MTAQSVVLPRSQRLGISVVLLICGLLVFVFGTNYYSVFPTNDSQVYRVILAALFLGAALALRRNESAEHYSHIAYAFFIATVTYIVTSLAAGVRELLFRAIRVPMDTPFHLALIKVYEVVLVVVVILVLSKLWGDDLGSLYIKRGRLGLSLFIGLSLFVINTATGFATGAALGNAGGELVAQLPWALVFSLANGFMEELLFRGLFLRRFVAVVGEVSAIVVTSIVFTVMHAAASYMNPVEAVLFQIIIFPMALLLAYLMHKTDNVWGAALYHAGSDVFLFYLMAL